MAASGSTTLPQEFSNRTLVGNWYEDRYGKQASPRTTPIRDFNTTERVVCRDLPEGENDFLTTKQATDASRMTAPPPVNVKKPSLYGTANLTDRLAAYSTPAQLVYTLGPTSPEELASVPKPDMDTTYRHFFEDKRDEALASTGDANYFSLDNTHRRQSPVTKPGRELTESMHAPAAPGGAKGARGEVTRRPAESGNVYGVSVFVDEYAQWGTKLAGMKLGETVARKQTQYF